MKFTCEKALLVSALSVASRTVAQKSTIPCLEGVLLRAGVALQLTGYNLETGITVHVGAQIQEAGSCVMPARLFFDIVRKLPDEMSPSPLTTSSRSPSVRARPSSRSRPWIPRTTPSCRTSTARAA